LQVLLPEVTARAAAPALRLNLLEKEPAHFAKAVEVIRLLKDPVVDSRLDHICRRLEGVERGQIGFY